MQDRHQFRFRDDQYVLELVKEHPLYAGSWGVRRADSQEYITVRRDAKEALEDALGDVESLDLALNEGFEEMFGKERKQG